MDVFLSRLTANAMNYAIRSGIAITTTYALKQCTRLVKETGHDSHHREEIRRLQQRLESKIRILSPSIDMIELISARGNTTLGSALALTKDIRASIQRLGSKVAEATGVEECCRKKDVARSKSFAVEQERLLSEVVDSMKDLLTKIEDAIPLVSLAIATSGVNLSIKLSGTISPSRLLQASTFLSAADANYATSPESRQQVGPTWTLSLYMLFAGHVNRAVDRDEFRDGTWKEVLHKARVKLVRAPLDGLYELSSNPILPRNPGSRYVPADTKASEFAYQLFIIEDLDDSRVHSSDDDDERLPEPIDDVANAGIRDVVPVHEVSKAFYADTTKILGIGGDDESNNPVLLLKRDVHADPPRRMLERPVSQLSNRAEFDGEIKIGDGQAYVEEASNEQSQIDAQIVRESTPLVMLQGPGESTSTGSDRRLPADLDPEWMAFEVFVEDRMSDNDDENVSPDRHPLPKNGNALNDTDIASALGRLRLQPHSPTKSCAKDSLSPLPTTEESPKTGPAPEVRMKSSLSLLEMLIKLTALQQFRQDSHLAIEDELLNFFLEDSATAGAGADKAFRQRLRHDAMRRVGFDPYDESPVKRRGEEYIANQRGKASPRSRFDVDMYHGRYFGSATNEFGNPTMPPDDVRPSVELGHTSQACSPGSSSFPVDKVHTPSLQRPLSLQTQSNLHGGTSSMVNSSSRMSASPSVKPHPTHTAPAKTSQSYHRAQSEPL